MNIEAIDKAKLACFGVCCQQHAQCKRYAAVEGSDALHYIATCEDGAGGRPLFVPIRAEAVPC